jgi:hypothetical protein
MIEHGPGSSPVGQPKPVRDAVATPAEQLEPASHPMPITPRRPARRQSPPLAARLIGAALVVAVALLCSTILFDLPGLGDVANLLGLPSAKQGDGGRTAVGPLSGRLPEGYVVLFEDDLHCIGIRRLARVDGGIALEYYVVNDSDVTLELRFMECEVDGHRISIDRVSPSLQNTAAHMSEQGHIVFVGLTDPSEMGAWDGLLLLIDADGPELIADARFRACFE